MVQGKAFNISHHAFIEAQDGHLTLGVAMCCSMEPCFCLGSYSNSKSFRLN